MDTRRLVISSLTLSASSLVFPSMQVLISISLLIVWETVIGLINSFSIFAETICAIVLLCISEFSLVICWITFTHAMMETLMLSSIMINIITAPNLLSLIIFVCSSPLWDQSYIYAANITNEPIPSPKLVIENP